MAEACRSSCSSVFLHELLPRIVAERADCRVGFAHQLGWWAEPTLRLHRPNGEIAQRTAPVFARAVEHEAHERLGRYRDGEQHEVARERVVADIAGDVPRHAVAVVPND